MMFVTLLYEDAHLLAVDKPPGMVVIPARDEDPATSLRARLEFTRGEHLWVVHRIDRDTSGVVLFARDADTHRALNAAFESRAVRKNYVAFTRGTPAPAEGSIAIALHTARKSKMRPAHEGEPGALPSETRYRTLHARSTSVGAVAHVEAEPRTGRQHQIRVHFRAIGTPLLVDPLYGGCNAIAANHLGPGSPALSRLTLHAAEIQLTHPSTGAPLTIRAPLASDLAALRDWLRTQS